MGFEKWWNLYTTFKAEYPESPFILHMRISTQGKVDLNNVHPFPVDENTVMAHNGIIPATSTAKAKKDHPDISDTKLFVDEVLPQLSDNWLDHEWTVNMVEDAIGHSKLAFLTVNPALEHQLYILNSHMGDWIEGIWFSNTYGIAGTEFGKRNGRPGVKYSWSSSTKKNKKDDKKGEDKKPTGTGSNVVPMLPYKDSTANMMRWEEMKSVAEDMVHARRLMQLFGKININYALGKFFCKSCWTEINQETAECSCYEVACSECGDFAAWCDCGEDSKLYLLKDGELPPKEEEIRSRPHAWLMD